MSWLNFFARSSPKPRRCRPRTVLNVEALEDRLVPSTADLIAYRPVTDYFNCANFAVAASQEESYTLGPGIRINGDDDNANGIPDFQDHSGADNDLVRVDVAATGTAAQLTFTANLRVWTAQDNGSSQSKQTEILSGSSIFSGTVWVEYISTTHTTAAAPAGLTLTASDGAGSVSDQLVFHSFQSVVIAIGGNTQNPANVGDPNLGVFTIAANLYQQGYDPHMYAHDQVSSTGAGAAYNEVVSAVKNRNVDYVAIIGYSWGGGATYELAKGLQANTAIQGKWTLSYTAYIDGITHGWISSETRRPPGSRYHDNIYQRKDWLLKGNSVIGAVNLNVTNTTWGKNLVHTSIDDNAMVQSIIITNLGTHVVR